MLHLHMCFLCLIGIGILIYFVHQRPSFDYTGMLLSRNKVQPSRTPLYIVVVCCGQRVQETLVMIKSAIVFNYEKEYLKFLIFTEKEKDDELREKLTDWKNIVASFFDFEILPLNFPSQNKIEWMNLFKPCAAQRLFLPSLLTNVDSLLYVDTDTLFLSPISEIWAFFKKFNDSQMAALTPEHENENIGWYNRFARHPFYGRLGVNSGVMLMNLTRMREFHWEKHILSIHEEYKLRIIWGDQDIINIFFYYYPDKLFVMPCEYNYRPDHCMYMSTCNMTHSGVKLMHGIRGYFHTDKQPLFKIIYESMERYQLGSNTNTNFLMPLRTGLNQKSVNESSCGKISTEVLKMATKLFGNSF
ncbi:glucoside xylosyltransferase 2 isoform X1 [Drosophila pseudoobscura]|uniref:UDP-D-xylose:beta-D-glucoside alpha-1,3-D-xylosyltransferase n=3 Tax=Drosophila pseudoobscura pseudoobscura TaxID=46245 RepID=A0A6I8V2S1_DROPS|nr:glucoside xylosyltransferase 2 isoform X1 [Drosophila pseudoobscura]